MKRSAFVAFELADGHVERFRVPIPPPPRQRMVFGIFTTERNALTHLRRVIDFELQTMVYEDGGRSFIYVERR